MRLYSATGPSTGGRDMHTFVGKALLIAVLVLCLSTVLAVLTMSKAHAQGSGLTRQYVATSSLPWLVTPDQNFGNIGNGFGGDFTGTGTHTITNFGAWLSYTGVAGTKPLAIQLHDGASSFLNCISEFKSWSQFGLASGTPQLIFIPVSGVDCEQALSYGALHIYWVESAGDPAESGDGTNQLQYWGADFIPYIALYSGEPDLSSHISGFDVSGFPSNTITFSTSYVSNLPLVDRVCVNLENITLFQSVGAFCDDINQNGFFNFSTTTVLATGSYKAWPVLYNGTQIVDSEAWTVFTAGTSTQSFEPGTSGWRYGQVPGGTSSTSTLSELTLECDPNDGFFSRSVCNLAVLLFVPSEDDLSQLDVALASLFTKQPFSVFNEFRLGWLQSVQNPNVPDTGLILVFYGENVEVISSSTFASVVGDNGWDIMRELIGFALWIAFGWFAFNRVQRLF